MLMKCDTEYCTIFDIISGTIPVTKKTILCLTQEEGSCFFLHKMRDSCLVQEEDPFRTREDSHSHTRKDPSSYTGRRSLLHCERESLLLVHCFMCKKHLSSCRRTKGLFFTLEETCSSYARGRVGLLCKRSILLLCRNKRRDFHLLQEVGSATFTGRRLSICTKRRPPLWYQIRCQRWYHTWYQTRQLFC